MWGTEKQQVAREKKNQTNNNVMNKNNVQICKFTCELRDLDGKKKLRDQVDTQAEAESTPTHRRFQLMKILNTKEKPTDQRRCKEVAEMKNKSYWNKPEWWLNLNLDEYNTTNYENKN